MELGDQEPKVYLFWYTWSRTCDVIADCRLPTPSRSQQRRAMRGTKMRRCRKEYLLLVPLVGILGQDAWWKPGPGVNWDVSEAAVHTLLRAQQVVTLYRTLVCVECQGSEQCFACSPRPAGQASAFWLSHARSGTLHSPRGPWRNQRRRPKTSKLLQSFFLNHRSNFCRRFP